MRAGLVVGNNSFSTLVWFGRVGGCQGVRLSVVVGTSVRGVVINVNTRYLLHGIRA